MARKKAGRIREGEPFKIGGRLRRPGAKPPKAVLDALLPLKVIEYAATGKGWYIRLSEEVLSGWRPRDPENPKKIFNAEELLAWATEGAKETLDAMAELSLREIGKIAYADIRKVFNEDGSLKAPQDWPDDLAGAIASVETEELFAGRGEDRERVGATRKVKFWDKKGANELILRAAGTLKERHEVTGKDGGPIQTEDVSARDKLAGRIAGIASRIGAGKDAGEPQ